MTPARFARLLDQHGPAIERWPAMERQAARRLLGISARSRRSYLAALDAEPADGDWPDPAVLARMAEHVRRRVAEEPVAARRHGYTPVLRVARWGALAACAVLGAWLGQLETAPRKPLTVLASLQITALDPSSPDPLR